MRKNRYRKEKRLWTENPEGEPLFFYVAEDEEDEASFVVQKIMDYVSNGKSIRPYRDISVFYRINAQSRAIEDELVKKKIPYTVVGGMKFYERKEIKDVLAYLKLIDNPSDGLSLRRVINVPPRGIGEKTIEKIETFSKEKQFPLYEGLRKAIEEDWLSPAAKARMKEFVDLIETFRRDAEALTLSQLTLALLAKTEYLQRLKEEGTDEALSKVENVDELINVMMGL